MTVLNFAALKSSLASPSRRRAAAMAATTLVTLITAVGALPAQAATTNTAAAIDPSQPVASADAAQALTVPAGAQSTVQEVDNFATIPAEVAPTASAEAEAEAEASAPAEDAASAPAAVEAAPEQAPAAEPAPAPEPAPEPTPAPPAVQWPFESTEISDDYGPREAPCSGCSTFHDGLDMTPGAGTPIGAIADGVVKSVSAYDNGGLGVHAIIEHVVDGQSLTSTYGHMTAGSLMVSPGQQVSAGQQLGTVGSTGQSTGPHLHLEIYLDGVTPTDPYAWLTEHAGSM